MEKYSSFDVFSIAIHIYEKHIFKFDLIIQDGQSYLFTAFTTTHTNIPECKYLHVFAMYLCIFVVFLYISRIVVHFHLFH